MVDDNWYSSVWPSFYECVALKTVGLAIMLSIVLDTKFACHSVIVWKRAMGSLPSISHSIAFLFGDPFIIFFCQISLWQFFVWLFPQESPLQQILSPMWHPPGQCYGSWYQLKSKTMQTSRPAIFDILLIPVKFYQFCLTEQCTLWRLWQLISY